MAMKFTPDTPVTLGEVDLQGYVRPVPFVPGSIDLRSFAAELLPTCRVRVTCPFCEHVIYEGETCLEDLSETEEAARAHLTARHPIRRRWHRAFRKAMRS